MQKMKLQEILKDQTITSQFDFSGSCIDKDGTSQTFTIFTTAFFLSEVLHNYFNRETFIQDPDNAFMEFVGVFNNWKYTRGTMYAKIMYAYSFGYNPIENYSSVETTLGETSLKHGLSTQRTYNNDKITTSHGTGDNADKVTRTYNQEKSTDKSGRYGANSSSLVDVTEASNEMTGSHTDTYSGTKSDEHTGGYTDENSGKDITGVDTTTTKSGNIGVMTPGQMIDSDYNAFILHEDLQQRAIKEFLDRYTFYSEGVNLW